MAIAVFTVYIRIVVNKILIARIVRWINIYHINLTLMCISKSGERFEVVTFDKDMVRRIGRLTHDGTLRHLRENRQFVHKTCFYFFWLVLHTKPYFFCERRNSTSEAFSSFVKPSSCVIFFASSYLFMFSVLFVRMLRVVTS